MMNRCVVACVASAVLSLFAVPSAFAQGWAYTGRLNHDRVYHTETLLQNGEALIAGGVNNDGQTMNLAELYNPATGTFSYTGHLQHDRKYHTATLLQNGEVLIVGGENNDGQPMALCELYNPATGTFSYTGSLSQARSIHTATLLPNGTVLVAGGFTQSKETGTTASAELYNPTTGTWTNTGRMLTDFARATATLLQNGQVLVAGGVNNAGSEISFAQLYDPATGTFSGPTGGGLLLARAWHTATLLQNGDVLIAGGRATTAFPPPNANYIIRQARPSPLLARSIKPVPITSPACCKAEMWSPPGDIYSSTFIPPRPPLSSIMHRGDSGPLPLTCHTI